MANFFNPDDMGDKRLHAPATARNRDILKDVFQKHIPNTGVLLEIASGTGEHAYHIAPSLGQVVWQPTDIEENHLLSIDAWRDHALSANRSETINIRPAQKLNILDEKIPLLYDSDLTAICAINLIHIAPFSVTEALIRHAGTALKQDGILFLYGPYKQNSEHTSQSNADFDQSLKSRNPSWGVRDMETITELAMAEGFNAPEIIPMPANNFSLVFKKS
ncbi:DUF938 domain-containing protein [Kordiimonas sp. SCSIO 12610]|uniref:DUF938 domain-containing protein n=1 Tax=Kordiimonas sp. SCSIO 12610 TaxID=2829597 RepID=UPI00210E564E|nr:DUF938 domain-containing protein [Kordiimonas sp. SCSIO 12610]UTW55568.1 DUF938 domain-containing protein [Kordiimonas sp. SCSIO 12610]